MFETLKTRARNLRRRRETAAELQALTDRELLDIGISRWEIERLADEVSQPRR
jgi:uncharacterized protein YjiS (DUF1127 family)